MCKNAKIAVSRYEKCDLFSKVQDFAEICRLHGKFRITQSYNCELGWVLKMSWKLFLNSYDMHDACDAQCK